jgi:peptidoglycan/LPS O-acetylase OafA/YrhL
MNGNLLLVLVLALVGVGSWYVLRLVDWLVRHLEQRSARRAASLSTPEPERGNHE